MRNNIDSFTRSTVDRILSDFKASLENCGLAAKLGKLGPPEHRSKIVGPSVPSSRTTAAEPRSVQVSDEHDSLIVSIVYSPGDRSFKLFAYKVMRRLKSPRPEVLYGCSSVDLDRVENDLVREIGGLIEKYLPATARPSRTL